MNIFNRETLLCEIIDNVLARRWGLSTIDKPYNDTPHNTQKEIAADRGRMYNRMKKAQGGRDGRTFGEDKMSSPKTAELIAQQTGKPGLYVSALLDKIISREVLHIN